MKIFSVGGAVRDDLLDQNPKDRDFVVVGSSSEEMISLGYELVGQDFPVFLKDGHEYALARRERSTGKGYHDFEVDFGPDVTIEEDLLRRDFTINAMARDLDTGELIDPYGGRIDLANNLLRAVNATAFTEDPVRVLRLARFAARFPGFHIDRHTMKLAESVDISHCTPERVALEFIKALEAIKPSKFFDTLLELDLLDVWFFEVAALYGKPQPVIWHAEGDAYTHTMMVLDASAREDEDTLCRFACLVHDLGKGQTPLDVLPSHRGHEMRGVPLVDKLCDRLKLSNDFRRIGKRVAKYHTHVHNVDQLQYKTFAKVFEDIKSHPDDSYYIATAAYYDNEGKLPYEPYLEKDRKFVFILHGADVKLSDGYTPEEIIAMSIESRKNNLHKLRIAGVKERKDSYVGG